MNKVIKLIFALSALTAAAAIIAIKFMPGGRLNDLPIPAPLKDALCSYPVEVRGTNMEPAIKANSKTSLNKCIEDKNALAAGTIVMYEIDGMRKLSRIRERLERADGLRYLVSQDARAQDTSEILPAGIVGVYEQ